MINLLEKLDFPKIAENRYLPRLLSKAEEILRVDKAGSQARLDSLRATALSSHANYDLTGFLTSTALYYLTLMIYMGGWNEEIHKGWHDVVETNGLGAACRTGQMLAHMAFAISAFASDEEDLRMLLRVKFNLDRDPESIASAAWEQISSVVEFNADNSRVFCQQLTALLRSIDDWGPWNEAAPGTIGAIDAVAAASPKLAAQMGVEMLIYAINCGILSDQVMGEVWNLMEVSGVGRPEIPSPADLVFGESGLDERIADAIRNALGNIGEAYA